jgi:hypothetical protein
VLFALQNNVPVSVAFAVWRFDSTLAVVLLVAVGLGAFITALVSSPSVIRDKWAGARLRRQVMELEGERASNLQRIGELESELARLRPAAPTATGQPAPYVGLKTLITGGGSGRHDG